MTVNLWVFPPPDYYSLSPALAGFKGITVTFTRPDGTNDTFMPLDGSAGHQLVPGQTEEVGTLYFHYTPNQTGTWSVMFTMPEQSFTDNEGTVTFTAVTSQPTTFTVQQDPVNAGVLNGWPYAPLPTGYWTRPIHSDNREWYQISGDWLQQGYDDDAVVGSRYNPYSTAPNTGHIVWTNQVSMGGLIGGPWGSYSYNDGGGAPPVLMAGFVYYNMPGNTFRCVDLRTGELIWEKTGSINLGWHYRAKGTEAGLPNPEAAGVTPYLVGTGTTAWTYYDPLTGNLLLTLSGVPTVSSGKRVEAGQPDITVAGRFATYWAEGDTVVYCIQESGYNTTIPDQLAINNLIKWDYSQVTGNNWSTGIVWNVTMKGPDGSAGPGDAVVRGSFYTTPDRSIGVACHMIGGENLMKAFNLTDGSVLWTVYTPFVNECVGKVTGTSIMFNFDPTTSTLYGYNMTTGAQLWKSDPIGDYPGASKAGCAQQPTVTSILNPTTDTYTQ